MVRKTILLLCLVLFPIGMQAQELIQDTVEIVKATVLTQTPEEEGQTLFVRIEEGSKEGQEVELYNDYVTLSVGETFYLRHTTSSLDGYEYYGVADPNRMPTLIVLIILFILSVVLFGGVQGLRGLIALAGSFVLILFVLMPQIAGGASPVLGAIIVSSIIIILGSYITHGFNRVTTAAVLGMIATVIITGIMAFIAVGQAKLTGFASDEATYLNINTGGSIDFIGLLFAGIIIGLLGVLYDTAIGQAVAVDELNKIGPHVPRKMIYSRAIRMGREHIGAIVNTLVIAYVGVSLPLLLLFYTTAGMNGGAPIINQELFATEIVRTMIGSIGIVLAVPITTLIAVYMNVKKRTGTPTEEELEQIKKLHTH